MGDGESSDSQFFICLYLLQLLLTIIAGVDPHFTHESRRILIRKIKICIYLIQV